MCLSGLNLDEICGLDEREIFLAVAAWSEVPGCPGLRLGLIGFFTCFFLVFYESSHQNTTNRFFSGNPGKGSIFYHSMCFRCSKKILKEVFHGIPPCSYLFVDSLWFSVRVCVCVFHFACCPSQHSRRDTQTTFQNVDINQDPAESGVNDTP